MLPNMPTARGDSVGISCFADADHEGNVMTRRLHTGILVFANNALISWFSKRQNAVECSTFGSEFAHHGPAVAGGCGGNGGWGHWRFIAFFWKRPSPALSSHCGRRLHIWVPVSTGTDLGENALDDVIMTAHMRQESGRWIHSIQQKIHALKAKAGAGAWVSTAGEFGDPCGPMMAQWGPPCPSWCSVCPGCGSVK
jgi:hypothetical protein